MRTPLPRLIALLTLALLMGYTASAQRLSGALESVGEANTLVFRGYLGVRGGVLYVLRGLNASEDRKAVLNVIRGTIDKRSPLYLIGYDREMKEVLRRELVIPKPKAQSDVGWGTAVLDDSNHVQLYFTAFDNDVPGRVLYTCVFSLEGRLLVSTKPIELVSQFVQGRGMLSSSLDLRSTSQGDRMLIFRRVYLDQLDVMLNARNQFMFRRRQSPLGFSYKLLGRGTRQLLAENAVSFSDASERNSILGQTIGKHNEVAVLVQTARRTDTGLSTLKQIGSDLSILLYDSTGKQSLYDLKMGETKFDGGVISTTPEQDLLVSALFRQYINDREQVGLAHARVKMSDGYIKALDFALITDVFPRDPYERQNTEINFTALKSLPDGSYLLHGEYIFDDPKLAQTPKAPMVLKDVFIARINPDLSTRWTLTLPKHQISVEKHEYSSYSLLNDSTTAYVLWNDYPENLNSPKPTQPADLDKVRRVTTCMAAVDLNTGAVLGRKEAFQTQDIDRYVWAWGQSFSEIPTDYFIVLTNSRQYKLGWLQFKR